MTNSIAIALLLIILGVFAADFLWFQGGLPLFAARQMDRLIEYVSFWR
ncbi:hypothetical protein [Paracoccus sp. (in: a-proteobacteria)]|nr:hypothetical protein [Paracoccus sp. (in: a-proteobacteria)]MDO5646577.1 hypothetical protein [Paracoccus sp. (in: a-proteobacteria)]